MPTFPDASGNVFPATTPGPVLPPAAGPNPPSGPGGPTFPAPPAAPPAPPPAPPASPRSTSKTPRILIAVLVVLIAAVTSFFVIRSHRDDTAKAAVGACVQVKSASFSNADTNQIDCAYPAAAYVVTETGNADVSCDTHEAEYTQTLNGDTRTKVCLRPNLKAGDCWGEGRMFQPSVKYPCSAVPAEVKASAYRVLAVETTTSDDSACPDDTTASLPLTKRNLVYCFASLT